MERTVGDKPPPTHLAVITPAYNRHDLTVQCVASVVAELRPTDDFIIVDDGSVPPLAALDAFKDLDARVRIVRHEVNQGLLAARNTLLRELPERVHWVLFLDSDDRLLPGWRDLVDRAIAGRDELGLFWFDRIREEDGSTDNAIHTPGQALTLDALCAGQLQGNLIGVVDRTFVADFAFDDRAWGWESVLWASVLRRTTGRHIAAPIAIGPTSGASLDSASANRANYAPDRARGMALGAELFISALSPLLPRRYPDSYRDLVLTALTWRVIAGDASVRGVIRAHSGLRGATLPQQTRWLSLVVAAALPDDLRRSLVVRRSRSGSRRAFRRKAAIWSSR